MSQQFLRQLSLIVSKADDDDGIDFGQFWCTFTVKRGDNQTPNSLDARIYNLSKSTATKMAAKEYSTLTLSAGYAGKVGLLFQGTIKQFRQGRVNQLDSYVDLTAADGDEAYNFAPVFVSLPAGSTQGMIATQIADAMKNIGTTQTIAAGYRPNFVDNGLVRGRVLYGMARDEARDFATQNSCKWSIQDGALTFIPYVSYIPGGDIPLISVGTGLIGVPEQTPGGINIRTLLNPAIKVGQLIQLDAQVNQFRFGLDTSSNATNPLLASSTALSSDGLYYVMCANHSGDTRGENWYSDLTCLSVDATVPSAEAANALFGIGPVPIERYGST